MTHHPSFPVTLSMDYDGGTSYTQIGQVRDVEGPELSREEIEVPPHHGIADNFKRFFAGVAEAGQITFPITLDWNDSTHIGATGLQGSFEDVYNGTSQPRFQYQNTGMEGGTATWVARGFVANLSFVTGNVQGHADAEVTIRIDGKPTLTIT